MVSCIQRYKIFQYASVVTVSLGGNKVAAKMRWLVLESPHQVDVIECLGVRVIFPVTISHGALVEHSCRTRLPKSFPNTWLFTHIVLANCNDIRNQRESKRTELILEFNFVVDWPVLQNKPSIGSLPLFQPHHALMIWVLESSDSVYKIEIKKWLSFDYLGHVQSLDINFKTPLGHVQVFEA